MFPSSDQHPKAGGRESPLSNCSGTPSSPQEVQLCCIPAHDGRCTPTSEDNDTTFPGKTLGVIVNVDSCYESVGR